MSAEIYIVSHKNIKPPKKEGYIPIQVGHSSENFDGYVRDDMMDNISEKNDNYCELTAQYWIWKNTNSDVKGLVHYRRFFNSKKSFSQSSRMKNIISSKDVDKILKEYDLILPKKRNYYIETSYSHYVHAHKKEGLDVTRRVIASSFPQYLNSYDKVVNRKKAHMFNMIIANKNVFDEYSSWLFDVLYKVENNLDISEWNKSESRVYGYVSELLLDVWLNEHSHLRYKELPVGFIGNQHWIKKVYSFLKRKIRG